MAAVQDYFVERMTGVHCDALEHVVTKLHEPPCTNNSKEIEGKTIGDIVNMFWLYFKNFHHKTVPFDKEARWLTNTASVGKSHIWNKFYSLPYAVILGFISCIVY